MDEKKLLTSLTDITTQLKNIAAGLGVSTGIGVKKGAVTTKSGLSKEDLAKQKEIAKLNAEEYKKTLGLNFKDSANIDKIATRFKVVFGIAATTKLLTNVRDHLKEFKDKWIKFSAKLDSSTKDNSNLLVQNLGWDTFKDKILDDLKEEKKHRQIEKVGWASLNKKIDTLIGSLNKIPKKETGFDLKSKLKDVAGLALIGGGIYLIVQALVNAGDIDISKTLKVFGVVSAFMLLFYAVSDKSAKIKAASIGFAILSATISFLIIPLIKTISSIPLDEYISGLFKFSLIILSCIGLMKLMEKIKGSDVLKSVGGLALLTTTIGFLILPILDKIRSYNFGGILEGLVGFGLVVGSMWGITKIIGKIFEKGIKETLIGVVAIVGLSLLLNYVANNLKTFTDFNWSDIYKNLGLAVLAIGLFGAVVTGIGLLVANPVIAPLLSVGSVVVLGLSFLMNRVAESLKSFDGINGDNLSQIGKGIGLLGLGLVSFLAGMTAGVVGGAIGKLSSFFGLDPASQIKKFESIDAEKISLLGNGLKNMGEGLKTLSSGIDFKNIANGLISMTLPLVDFTKSLDGFNKSFSQLDKNISESEIKNIYKLKIEGENNIQNSILELNKQELEIQRSQLIELVKNNQLLEYIANNIGSGMGKAGGSVGVIGNTRRTETVTSASFNTKDNYMNHMKLTSMSFT